MAAENGKQGFNLSLPTKKKLKTKNEFSLVFEIIWLAILMLLEIPLAAVRCMVPLQGKTLNNQVVLVTGAGRGFGQGLALGFAKEGCKVAVADINKVNAEQTAAEINKAGGIAKAYFANVAKVQDVAELRTAITRDLGPVDILVNNAGVIHTAALEDETEESIETVISINLTSHFWMVKEFLPTMKERNSGHIVAISSMAALNGAPNGSTYSAAKSGVIGFMDSVRAELNSRVNNDVKTTTVLPYFINTSAHYVESWDLRIAPISIEEAVNSTIAGVKRGEVSFSIPRHMYFFILLNKLWPQSIMDKTNQIISVNVAPQQLWKKDPSFK